MATLRVLLTGFSAFPGAPVNPTAELVGMIAAHPPELGPDVELTTALLPVDYRRIPLLLDELGRRARPHIALHFGLARSAEGFRLEVLARNRVSRHAPDAAGHIPDRDTIVDGGPSLRATLPPGPLQAALCAVGLPVTRSSHAGAYLCNFTFYLSCAGHRDWRPPAACFVHVPYLDDQLPALPATAAGQLATLTRNQLRDGAITIARAAVETVRAARAA